MNRLALGVLAVALALTGCSGTAAEKPSPPALVTESGLEDLLLRVKEVDEVMATTGMAPHPLVTTMGDHRNLLPNLNCLGVWQVDESAIYGPDGWSGVRQQLLRAPDGDNWDNLVVQSVIAYPTEAAARDFFTQSAQRWSKCTNHNVNITLNGQPLPKWRSGALTQTATSLAIPFTRSTGDQSRDCQRVLAVKINVIADVQACTVASAVPAGGLTAASRITERITDKLGR